MASTRMRTIVLLVSLVGCAGAARPERDARAPQEPRPAERSHELAAADQPGESGDPDQTVARADGLYRDQLAVQGRDERFSTDRQIAALRQAIALYRQFIERAGGEPEYREAVRRSRDRIEDAEATIAFLLDGQSAENESP